MSPLSDRCILETGACPPCSTGCLIVWHDGPCARAFPVNEDVARDGAAASWHGDFGQIKGPRA
jgi:hypothetical protein